MKKNCCNECDENRIICKKDYKTATFKSKIVSPDILRRAQLFLAIEHDFYMCKLTNIDDNQEHIKKVLKSRNVPINDNLWYISCDYDGRNYYNDHFMCGWCIIHHKDGIVYDSVGLVS